MKTRWLYVLLSLVVAVYIAVGVLYAVYTPPWQVPDEPAHYNYVRALAEGEGLPVMEPGDYDQRCLECLKARRFPATLSPEDAEACGDDSGTACSGYSVAEVTYEDHQPPLYYLLAAPLYRLFGGGLLPLRLFSVFIGALLLAAVFGVGRAVFPSHPQIALMAAAFVAFIPQHVAMMAGVNNDALAELVAAGVLWALIRYVCGVGERPWPIGVLLAAALWTKGSVYALPAVAAIAVALRWRRERRPWLWVAGQLAWILTPMLLLALPWGVRNGLVYGWNDLTAQARHDAVVVGQMRPLDYVALNGWASYWERACVFTFQSFWGQFGWMGVLLPASLYRGLALLSIVMAAGFLWWLFDRRRPRLSSCQRASLTLMLAVGLCVALMYVWYNTKFVQHQGRYLFTALAPLGVAAALGIERMAAALPSRVRAWGIGVFFTGMALFDVYCLFRVIVPALT